MDALCVYFWATTPVLISTLTFGTYVLIGNELNAKTIFTSMALLNMLIGPLNAFPWVLNGLTEAWVSVKRVQRLLDVRMISIILQKIYLFISFILSVFLFSVTRFRYINLLLGSAYRHGCYAERRHFPSK